MNAARPGAEWLLVAGDFTPLGGMDRANHALATGLCRRGYDVSLVTHRVWADLAGRVHPTIVPRPAGSHILGAPLLARAGRSAAGRLRRGRMVVNGGNTAAPDVTWIHYVHASHEPAVTGRLRRLRTAAAHRYYLRRERAAVRSARYVVCNSRRTAADLTKAYGVAEDRLRIVYYGCDPSAFGPADGAARRAARRELGWPEAGRLALFVGALGDRRKGFDRLFEAWRLLSRDPAWDVELAVAGAGAELSAWAARSRHAGLDTIRFLGFRTDIATVMAASDVLVHPARYEAYGLGVHEALCRGLPAVVSAHAGVAERYDNDLCDLLVHDPEDPAGIAARLRTWRSDEARFQAAAATLSARLRSRTWDDMSADFLDAVDA